MKTYWRFLWIGLILGLFTEFELKLVAGINPPAFIIALFAYPILLSLAYAGSRFLDRFVSSTWKGDVLHYIASGLGGLAIEWGLLGNGPGSNAIQLGMFAMWTTFCFGPRVLTRNAAVIDKARRWFWTAFGIAAVLLTVMALLMPSPEAKLVIVVLSLSGTYLIWSIWLLYLAWKSRREGRATDAPIA